MEKCSNILPFQFRDSKGRTIKIQAYMDSDYKGLKNMYDAYDPKGLEAGLPPANERIRHEWVDQMVSSFYNIVATHQGLVIGHAALDVIEKGCSREYLIFLNQGYRRCGIGTKLSEIAKQSAKDMGCKKVWLSVRTANAIAIRVFKKVGFNFVGKIDIQRNMELKINKLSD